MEVTRREIVARGLRHRCPNCGEPGLFVSAFRLRPRCRACALPFERGEGFFLGSMAINYGVTCIFWLFPVALLWAFGILPRNAALVLGLGGAILFPVAFYRTSRLLWLTAYFFFLPQELPRNGGTLNPEP